jgi:hypothetical protein
VVTERTLAPNLPRLLEPERRTPRQMQLASTLCSLNKSLEPVLAPYGELAPK